MKVFADLPEDIETELGKATIGRVSPEKAIKPYLCPLCDSEIETNESHVIAVPIEVPKLRRHLHGECLGEYLRQNLAIKLHPKEPDVMRYYLFGDTG
jgi:hypothetical protein